LPITIPLIGAHHRRVVVAYLTASVSVSDAVASAIGPGGIRDPPLINRPGLTWCGFPWSAKNYVLRRGILVVVRFVTALCCGFAPGHRPRCNAKCRRND
jgi:hypothetical protein